MKILSYEKHYSTNMQITFTLTYTYFDYLAPEDAHAQQDASPLFYRAAGEDLQHKRAFDSLTTPDMAQLHCKNSQWLHLSKLWQTHSSEKQVYRY